MSLWTRTRWFGGAALDLKAQGLEPLQQPCSVVADAGYANGEHIIAALDAQGITSYVAGSRSVNHQGDSNLYQRSAFVYDHTSDDFSCPAGNALKRKDKMVVYA
ncbi:MAG: hypothetical protein V4645_09210 [Pseudomonadota bacterium]